MAKGRRIIARGHQGPNAHTPVQVIPMDKRNRCKANAPAPFKGRRTVVSHVDHADYYALYIVTMHLGVSMAEALRILIRNAHANLPADKTEP